VTQLTPGAPKLVLYAVDDEQENVDVLVRVLSSLGEVKGFTSATAALAAMGESPPTAIAIDQRMPGLTGVQCLEAMRARGIHCPALIVTAFIDLDEVVLAQKNRLAVRIVPKPVDAQTLREHMAAILRPVTGLDTHRERMTEVVEDGLRRLHAQLGLPLGSPATSDTRLAEVYGSLELAMLVVNLEDAIRDRLGIEAQLTAIEDLMRRGGPMSTVGSLVDFLAKLVMAEK